MISDDRDVYLIQPVDGGLAKIGVADNPQERLHTIQLMCPVQLQLIDVIRGGGHMLEHGLHTRFAEDRSHGEWFRPSDELFGLFLTFSRLDCALDDLKNTEAAIKHGDYGEDENGQPVTADQLIGRINEIRAQLDRAEGLLSAD